MATEKSKRKKRFKTAANFDRVRENASEFDRCGKTGKLLYDSVRVISAISTDKNAYSRLRQFMKKVIDKDLLSDRGMRTVTSDGLPLLRGFNFNKEAMLTSVFFAPFSAAIDRAAGTATVNVPEFIPDRMLKKPVGATHITILSGVAEIDFVTGAKTVTTSESEPLVLGTQAAPAISLTNTFAANSTKPVFLFLGLRYTVDTNDKDYELKAKAFNALSIVEISTAA